MSRRWCETQYFEFGTLKLEIFTRWLTFEANAHQYKKSPSWTVNWNLTMPRDDLPYKFRFGSYNYRLPLCIGGQHPQGRLSVFWTHSRRSNFRQFLGQPQWTCSSHLPELWRKKRLDLFRFQPIYNFSKTAVNVLKVQCQFYTIHLPFEVKTCKTKEDVRKIMEIYVNTSFR